MSARRILTLFFAAFVLVEGRWHTQKRELSSICEPMSENPRQILCFCIKDNRQQEDHIKSADCFLTVEGVNETDQAWDTFDQLKTALKITLTNARGIVLRYIPTHGLKRLDNVVEINIQYGNIEKVHKFAFANLSKVEEISLKDSQIMILQKHSFAHIKNLKEIKLDKNNIGEINRDVFIDLPSLEKLFLTENQITTIHDRAFIHLESLRELEINMNKLFSLNSETFSGLNKLQRLDLSGNSLEVIGDNTFFPLKNLMSLNLEGNKIQMIDNKAFHGLIKLKFLTLAHNKLPNINDEVFVGLNALISLSLKGNDIKDLNYKAMDPLLQNLYGNRSYLDIEDNVFTCNCKLDWFLHLMNQARSKTLKIALENLKCLPDPALREQWNKLDEKNSAEVFDAEGADGQAGSEYEYYDESQLNGKLFYTDVRGLIGCVKNESDVPVEIATQKIALLDKSVKEAKITTPSLATPIVSIQQSPEVTIQSVATMPKNNIRIRTAKPETNNGILDLSIVETTSKTKGDIEDEDVHGNKPDSYTTARLVNVSAKPINVYENMAADEAKPDKLKAQRSHEAEIEKPLTKKGHSRETCVALILLTCARLLFQ